MKNRIFRANMLFTLAELQMHIGEAGISLGMPSQDVEEYNGMAMESYNVGLNDIPMPSVDGMVIPEGLESKQEDFLYVPFRLLSATMVAAGSWRATKFKPQVLKKAVQMLQGKGVYTNHNDNPKNWLGYVAKTKWQNAQKIAGETIPAGINGLLGIDTTLDRNKDVAKGIVSGAVYSNSVSIMFNYKMSHEFDDDWEFHRRVGTIHEDGKMIHLEPTEVLDMYETSLVSLGADPYAKRIGADGLVNVDNGGVYTEKTENNKFKQENKQKKFYVSCGLSKNVIHLTGKKMPTNLKKPTKLTKKDMNKQVLNALLLMFGCSTQDDLTVEMVKGFKGLSEEDESILKVVNEQALSLVSEKNDTIDSVALSKFLPKHSFIGNDDLTNLKESEKKLAEIEVKLGLITKEKEGLEVSAKIGEDFLKMKRDLAKKFYRLEKMDDADESICELFDTATSEQLDALVKQHGIVIGGQFSYNCSDCGSHKFKFQSTVEGLDKPTKKDSERGLKLVSPETIREEARKRKAQPAQEKK